MSHRRRAPPPEPGPDAWTEEILGAAAPARPLIIIGAGTFLGDIVRLLREHTEFRIAGILDPAPALRGQQIHGIPVRGWLEDLPDDVDAAVIGNPAGAPGFDREAVFRLLARRHIFFPILAAATARHAPDVILRRGTVLLDRVTVAAGATLGENCLLGAGASVAAGAQVADHALVAPAAHVAARAAAGAADAQPRSLAATLARETDNIRDVIQRINWANMEIILVVDAAGRLLGTITDGDIRRGILAGVDLDRPVALIMNRDPVTVPIGAPHGEMLEIMRRRSIRHLPVVDNEGRPVRLERMETLLDELGGQAAVVMAGGLGARLRPLTNDTPKPLLPVGGRPILDHILAGLRDSGIEDVCLSVNYLGDRIREHVGSGRGHQLNVNYIAEKERLGTAGALALLRPRPRRPFLVMNGDLLTRMNFAKLLRFQREHRHDLVMCVRRHALQIPYGVVELRDGLVAGLREKPVQEFFINAGIYVLQPRCIELIPAGRYFDMTDLAQAVLDNGGTIGAFPILEYWRDIGRPEDLQAAGREQAEAETPPDTTTFPAASVPMELVGGGK